MRILWLTETYYPNRGGMAHSCDRIVQSLREERIDVDVIHFTNRRPPFQVEQKERGTYVACPLSEDPAHVLNRLWNHLDGQPNNWTHLVAFGGFLPSLGAPILASWLDLPLVLLLRGNDLDLSLFSPRRRPMLQDAVLAAKQVCVVTREHQQKLTKIWPKVSVQYVPNGIDLRSWQVLESDRQRATSWRQQDVAKGLRVLGLFGHLKEKKGFPFLLDALHLSGISDSVHLLIVGELGPTSTDVLAHHSIAYSRLPFLDRYELMAYYPACDAIAIPSFYDGMPNVLLEAGALGIPFIAARTGGMRDLLLTGIHGFVFDVGDRHACADALHTWVQTSTQEMNKMGEACKQLVQTHYTHKAEVRKYLEVFRSILL
ncbi:MAG: glycosyltransferase family 4 protein [Bacteroidota bacterium]